MAQRKSGVGTVTRMIGDRGVWRETGSGGALLV
jgi:hypothetical protein